MNGFKKQIKQPFQYSAAATGETKQTGQHPGTASCSNL